jgi:hypothetical protein
MHQPAGAEGNNVVKWLGKLWWGGGRWRGRRMDISASRDSPRLPAAPRDSLATRSGATSGHCGPLLDTAASVRCIGTLQQQQPASCFTVAVWAPYRQAGSVCISPPATHVLLVILPMICGRGEGRGGGYNRGQTSLAQRKEPKTPSAAPQSSKIPPRTSLSEGCAGGGRQASKPSACAPR